jgi:DNA-binding LacI/PurR family transcriptional regulator
MTKLTPAEIRRIATDALVHPQTVQKYLAGEGKPLKPLTRGAVEVALAALGYASLVRRAG